MLSELQQNLQVKVSGTLPIYASTHAAGADLFANINSPLDIEPGSRYLVPTNTVIELPIGYEAQVRPRSGLAIKHGITLINSPGTIDADYRGEIMVPIINLGQETYTIQPQERIAQLVIQPVVRAKFISELQTNLSVTNRGAGGFGSSGSVKV